MVLIFLPGQLQQVLERELPIDLGLGKPSPSRYHAWVTLARRWSGGLDGDSGCTGARGDWRLVLIFRGIVGSPLHIGQLKLINDHGLFVFN
jgi:hypothetical protein